MFPGNRKSNRVRKGSRAVSPGRWIPADWQMLGFWLLRYAFPPGGGVEPYSAGADAVAGLDPPCLGVKTQPRLGSQESMVSGLWSLQIMGACLQPTSGSQ